VILFVIFLLIIFCYSLAFHLAFGPDIQDHSTLGLSFATLIRTLFGDFDYQSLADSDFILGPFMFLFFFFFVGLIVLNLFVAVIFDSYSQEQKTHEKDWERLITNMMVEELVASNHGITLALIRAIKFVLAKLGLVSRNVGKATTDDVELKITNGVLPEDAVPVEKHDDENVQLALALVENAGTGAEKSERLFMSAWEVEDLAEQSSTARVHKTHMELFNAIRAVEEKFEHKIAALENHISLMESQLQAPLYKIEPKFDKKFSQLNQKMEQMLQLLKAQQKKPGGK